MSASWTANDFSILLASVAGLVASCFAGARLSNCVQIQLCSDRGWLYIERRMAAPIPGASSPALPQPTASQQDLEVSIMTV
jgi:hypothetical protein